MSTLALESEAGLGGIVRRPRRYNALDCTSRPYPDRASAEPCPKHHWNSCYNYKCFPGCVRDSGDTKRICRYGRWTGTDLICKGSCCSVPRSPTGAEVSSSVYPYTDGAVITYRCSEWYTQESGSTTKTCSNGVWTGDDLVCKPYEGPIPVCSEPPSPANTTKKRCSLRSPPQQDDWCRYECSPGYVDIGGYDFRSCSRGVWIGRDLVCVRSCPAPDTDYTVITYCNPPLQSGNALLFLLPLSLVHSSLRQYHQNLL
ncbi:protein lev-9-like [Branchiostoma floridae x Branchiostoma japonicum]